MGVEIHRIGATKDRLGEGPLWDVGEQALYWVDSLGAVLHRHHPASGAYRAWQLPGAIGSLALRERGGAVLALETGLHFFDFDSGEATPIVDPEAGEPRTRFNDGKVDRQGRFLAGTMGREIRDQALGALYRLNPDLSLETLEREVIVSNGPCFSPDGKTFYFADSPRRAIFAFDYDGGPLRNKHMLIDTAALKTAPDGATVDAEGFIWSALVLSGRIGRFAPDGRLDRVVELPVSFPTSVMFGGASLDIAFITSISGPLAGRTPPEPEAGGLFAIHGLGVRGLPEPRFRG
ncbi:MAG TPA: SMP-30/gluconolactonase/LRE family protein [Stellaceae bacterium]|nr:SMP-30/gluconolactonase/LRE family protein [Stellaceae bacterium]